MKIIKELIREILILFHLDISKNIKYDRLTRDIMKKCLRKNFNCLDIGCHKGEILDLMLKYSPEGKHIGFEPIPPMFKQLVSKYEHKAVIYPYALSDSNGPTTFQFVKNAPAYSGLKRRHYDNSNPEIEEIEVEMKKLDDIIPLEQNIDFIKIDVEGGEFGVLKGGKNLLIKNKPIIIFECGKGASDYYGTNPAELFAFISNEIGLNIYTLNSFLKGTNPLTVKEFVNHFNLNDEYYFVAS